MRQETLRGLVWPVRSAIAAEGLTGTQERLADAALDLRGDGRRERRDRKSEPRGHPARPPEGRFSALATAVQPSYGAIRGNSRRSKPRSTGLRK